MPVLKIFLGSGVEGTILSPDRTLFLWSSKTVIKNHRIHSIATRKHTQVAEQNRMTLRWTCQFLAEIDIPISTTIQRPQSRTAMLRICKSPCPTITTAAPRIVGTTPSVAHFLNVLINGYPKRSSNLLLGYARSLRKSFDLSVGENGWRSTSPSLGHVATLPCSYLTSYIPLSNRQNEL